MTDRQTFLPLPRAHGVGPKKCAIAGPTHVNNSHTKFGWISSNGLGGDSVTDRQTFLPLPRAPGGRAKTNCAVTHPIHVSNSHTNFGRTSSNGLGVNSVTVGQTEAIAISPSLF